MKRPISLWVFGVGAMVMNILSWMLLSLMFYMPARGSIWDKFLIISIFLFFLLLGVNIELFRLKRWARNMFVIVTLIVNSAVVALLTTFMVFPAMNIFLMVFILSFTVYFLKPSTRRMFSR